MGCKCDEPVKLIVCDDNELFLESEDCGCNSEVRVSIIESAQLTGQIAFKHQSSADDIFFNEKFIIVYTESNCVNCVHHMIICNEDSLCDFQNLKNTPSKSVTVKFAGNLKKVCDRPFAPGDVTFEHIILTKIERL
jgi:hypothetical protein